MAVTCGPQSTMVRPVQPSEMTASPGPKEGPDRQPWSSPVLLQGRTGPDHGEHCKRPTLTLMLTTRYFVISAFSSVMMFNARPSSFLLLLSEFVRGT